MSKKHKHHQSSTASQSPSQHATEYSIIRHDLIKLVILNAIYLAGVLAIYFTNVKSHYLEHWFERILHF